MAKVEITSFKANTASKIGEKGTSVTKKFVRDAAGKRFVVRTIDMGSDTLTADLTYVFGRNVAKARKENKLSPDLREIEPAKS